MVVESPKRKDVAHDTSPAIISSHAFVPRAEWWSLCKICGLAQAAHAETTMTGREHIGYYSDDNPEEDD